jgi:hypothetical protein
VYEKGGMRNKDNGEIIFSGRPLFPGIWKPNIEESAAASRRFFPLKKKVCHLLPQNSESIRNLKADLEP